MADFNDYRPHLPSPEQSRIAGSDAISHAKAHLGPCLAAQICTNSGESLPDNHVVKSRPMVSKFQVYTICETNMHRLKQ